MLLLFECISVSHQPFAHKSARISMNLTFTSGEKWYSKVS